ncbi:MAG: hypothetical protein ACOZF0_07735 [Thermodesulfobacteriota bacterium]
MLRKWFSKRKKTPEYPDEMSDIARRIAPVIDRMVSDLFRNYLDFLMTRPPGYIVTAVWANEDSVEMDPVTREISHMVGPTLQTVFSVLDMKKPSRSQVFGISYLVRGLIISKVAFVLEALRNLPMNIRPNDGESAHDLRNMRPMGAA